MVCNNARGVVRYVLELFWRKGGRDRDAAVIDRRCIEVRR